MGVLVAISIPIFTSQLEKARLATNQANARAAYAAATADLTDDDVDISKWDVTITSAGKALGDATAKKRSVVLNKDGSVKGYLAAY